MALVAQRVLHRPVLARWEVREARSPRLHQSSVQESLSDRSVRLVHTVALRWFVLTAVPVADFRLHAWLTSALMRIKVWLLLDVLLRLLLPALPLVVFALLFLPPQLLRWRRLWPLLRPFLWLLTKLAVPHVTFEVALALPCAVVTPMADRPLTAWL